MRVHWKWGDGAQGLVLVEDGRGLPPSLPHVALHGVELGHGPAVRLPRSPFNHVAAVLWSPERRVAAHRECVVRVGRRQKASTGNNTVIAAIFLKLGLSARRKNKIWILCWLRVRSSSTGNTGQPRCLFLLREELDGRHSGRESKTLVCLCKHIHIACREFLQSDKRYNALNSHFCPIISDRTDLTILFILKRVAFGVRCLASKNTFNHFAIAVGSKWYGKFNKGTPLTKLNNLWVKLY